MTPAEARALIAEGRAHDEAMTAAPWKPCGGTKGQCICRLVWSIPADVAVCQAQSGDATGRAEDAAGIAWLRTNLARLLAFAEIGVLAHERDHQPFMPGQRDLVLEVCHDLINRTMRNESDPIPDQRYADADRAKEAAIRALLDGYTEALAEIERLRRAVSAADLIADMCGGVTGADDDDLICAIKVHFAERPSMWLRDAMIEAVDAYRKVRP